jgi:hypothetical protein
MEERYSVTRYQNSTVRVLALPPEPRSRGERKPPPKVLNNGYKNPDLTLRRVGGRLIFDNRDRALQVARLTLAPHAQIST